MTRLISIFYVALLLLSCKSGGDNSTSESSNKPVPNIDLVLLNSYPHDTTSFTEGFLFHEGKLYESTGASQELPQTKSLFGIVDLTTGKIQTRVEIDRSKYFGEGITFLNGKVYQLTYKTKVGFVYDAVSFKKLGEFTFPSKEGWGLTTDGTNLIMSDGTYELTYLDPLTFKTIKKLSVTENGFAKDHLNELEFVKGYIFANIWTTNTIVKIDPSNGHIVGQLNLNSLASEALSLYPGSLEMNGIAYDSTANSLYITGKLWPKIYELKID